MILEVYYKPPNLIMVVITVDLHCSQELIINHWNKIFCVHQSVLTIEYYYKDNNFVTFSDQMLQNEREEVASQLELDVPNLEVERRGETMLITIQLSRNAQVKIKWNIIWVAKNERLQYDISVICEDEGNIFCNNYLQI